MNIINRHIKSYCDRIKFTERNNAYIIFIRIVIICISVWCEIMKNVMTFFPVYFRYVENDYDSNINFSEDHNFGVIERLIDYIMDERKSKLYFFGTSGVVNTYCPRTLALQFYAVQAAFNQQRKPYAF